MFRNLMTIVGILALAPSVAVASHIGVPATWNFESPVGGFSSNTRTEYFYAVGAPPPILSSYLLGLQTTTPPTLILLDFFGHAQPYLFSFDLIFSGSSAPTEFGVVSHGQTIISAGDFSAAQLIGPTSTGGSVVRFSSLISPGATPFLLAPAAVVATLSLNGP